MPWEVEYTDEFEAWWVELSMGEQESVTAVVGVLEQLGPQLSFPYSSDVKSAKKHAIRELRIQHGGKPYRVCTRLTRVEWLSCCLGETRPAMTAGTMRTSHVLKRCSMSI